MITIFELFKNKKVEPKINIGKPKVGNYVILTTNRDFLLEKDNYILNNIGKIKKISKTFLGHLIYYVNYDKINIDFGELMYQIEYWSPNKEDLEIILATKNFNL